MQNKVVAHFLDNRLVKGFSDDFFPHKKTLHIRDQDSGDTQEVQIAELKALFFVKSFRGNPGYRRRENQERAGFGRRIRVRFKDGETAVGYTSGYSPDRPAFFLFPADPQDNNERVLVVNAATEKVEFL